MNVGKGKFIDVCGRIGSIGSRFLVLIRIKVGKAEVPRILLGCSPFFSLEQFGMDKSKLYRELFLTRTHNIVAIIKEAVALGVEGIQSVAPNGPVTRRIGKPPLIEAILRLKKILVAVFQM